MKNDKATNVVAGLTIVASWAFLTSPYIAFPPGINRGSQQALGQVLAEEAVKLLGNGGKITVITRDTTTYKNPSTDAQLRGFRDTLKQARVTVASTIALPLNPISLVYAPPGDFLRTMKKLTDADVIVSFMGPAGLNETQIAALGEKRPKVVALCTGTMPQRVNLKQLFDQKLLHAVVLNREHPLPGPPSSETPRAWFERLYQLATPTNFVEAPLPDPRP
jgi:hypothetical protein